MFRLLIAGGLAAVLAGCSPTSPPTDTTVSPTVPEGKVGATTSATPDQTRPVRVEPLPHEEYPAEVDGYSLVWLMGASAYDRGTDDRISVLPRPAKLPVDQWSEGIQNDHQELRPGVWCYVIDGDDVCMVNGTSGRLWMVIDRFETLSLDELAAWTEQFGNEIP